MSSLADIRYQAQLRADRVNAPIVVGDWNSWVNGSLAALYRILTALYDDYNVASYPFTLAGGVGIDNNMLQLGSGSSVPAFDKLRHLSRIVTGGGFGTPATYAPVLRADSFIEFDGLTASALMPYYGGLTQNVKYMLLGNTLEVRPASSAGASYVLYFIPSFKPLIEDTQTIDGTWMSTNGISEYAVLDVAVKALIKEESLDTAALLAADRERVKAEIVSQFAQRDDNQPGRIQDAKGARRSQSFSWGRW